MSKLSNEILEKNIRKTHNGSPHGIFSCRELRALLTELLECRRTQPENKPLTLDELQEMEGEPVWMNGRKEWAFVSVVQDEPYKQVWIFNRKGFAETVLFHHEIFYRSKPKEEV